MASESENEYQGLKKVLASKIEKAISKAMSKEKGTGSFDLLTLLRSQPDLEDNLRALLEVLANERAIEGRVETAYAGVKVRLDKALNAEGKIDIVELSKRDPDLFRIVDQYAMSKTWRDDPKITARDVAKLLEANSDSTELGKALNVLGRELAKKD